ncbi:MAG: ferric reductase-like transmembrane domain-containing protein [Acetobacteraceae bacterium]
MRRGLPPRLVAVLFVLLAGLPLLVAALSGEPPEALPAEAGIGLGLAALALMLLQFAHSGRLELLSGRIGIDRTMRLHRSAAIALLAMALLHPLAFVGPALLSNPEGALRGLGQMLSSPRMRTGVLALALLAALMAVSLWRERLGLPYGRWRALHAVGGLAAAALAVAHALAVGLYSEAGPLRWLWIGGLGLACLTLVLSWGLKPRLAAAEGWRVASVRPIGPEYWEMVVDRERAAPLPFAAGQFAWIAIGPRAPWDDNPFSMASRPGEPRLAFVIREAGDLTNRIGCIEPGTPVRLDAPHGAFVLAEGESRAVLLVAGGTGIAPILSIWRDLAARGHPAPVRLLYGAWRAEHLLYADELRATATARGFGLSFRVQDGPLPEHATRGRVTRDALAAALEGLEPARTLALVCGPTAMMLAVAADLEALGLRPEAILYERFAHG